MIELLLALSPLAVTPTQGPAQDHDPDANPVRALARTHSFPGFLENRGQWPGAVRFRSGGAGATAWFLDRGWRLALRGCEARCALEFELEGARGARPAGEEPRLERRHVLRGGDPERWVRGLETFERLRWSEPLAGVELTARAPRGDGSDGGGGALFEYDLTLAPGARLETLAFRVRGHEWLAVDDAGRLVLGTAVGELVQTPPLAWQETPQGPVPLACRFRRLDGERFGFEAPDRDPALSAVIDPALVFSTYLSGTGEQTVEEVAVAPNGDLIAAGTALSDDFPTTLGAFQELASGNEDVFVTRYAQDGTLLWSTLLSGLGTDLLRGLGLSSTGAVTVCGDTNSGDFPTLPGSFATGKGGFFDGFCTRLTPSGDALEFGTFLGGGLNDRAADLAVGANDETTVVGVTNGSGFPSTAGAFDPSFNGGVFGGDGFCLRLNASGQLVWSTFLGGSADDGATAVAVEAGGEVSVAGVSSGPWTMSPGAFDSVFSPPGEAWVVRLDAPGATRRFATYIGGAGLEEVLRLAVDGSGATVLAGRAGGPGFPVTAGALDPTFAGQTEGFVTRLADDGASLEWSTYVGGVGDEEVSGLALDPSGAVVVVGGSDSDDLPTSAGAFDRTYNASLFGQFQDGFVLKLAADGSALEYGTYFGTTEQDELLAVALDASGAALLGGASFSFGFPTTPGAPQPGPNFGATREGTVSLLAFLRHPIPYGVGTPPGSGGVATIDYLGFPDLAAADFRLRISSAAPKKKAILFHGFAPQASPFYGGTIYVQPPLKRQRPVLTDAFGTATQKIDLDPSWVGSTLYFQWWFKDPLLKKKTGLSNALEVTVYP